MGGCTCGAASTVSAIIDTFSSTGVTAGTAKRPNMFSAPAAHATSDMHRMYGNIHRVSSVARSNTGGVFKKPLAISTTRAGAATTPSAETASTVQNSAEATCESSSRASSEPPVDCVWAKIGTKACENAPSANRRRSRFGRRNATEKASMSLAAPKMRAISTSRTSPVMRDTRVSPLTATVARSKFKAGRFKQAERSKPLVGNEGCCGRV